MLKIGSNNRRIESCIGCYTRGDRFPSNSFGKIVSENIAQRASLAYNKVVNIGDFICNKCRKSANRAYDRFTQSVDFGAGQSIKTDEDVKLKIRNEDVHFQSESPLITYNKTNEEIKSLVTTDVLIEDGNPTTLARQSIHVNLPRAIITNGYCFICRRSNKSRKLHTLSDDSIHYALILGNIYLPENARSCNIHLDDFGLIKQDHLEQIPVISQQTCLDKQKTEKIINRFLKFGRRNTLFSKFSDEATLTDSLCKNNTGLIKIQFLELAESLENMNDSSKRTKLQALAIYLFWLKTGLQQRAIASHFEIDSHFDIFRYLKQVRKCLIENFVISNLGLQHLQRNEWLKQNSAIAKELFANDETQLILICDGTYCRIQKSSNYTFQRLTYSGHKKYNLVKPFVVTTTNGRIVDIFGIHPAIKNDATILKEILEDKKSGLSDFLHKNDILILDRGFMDVFQILKDVYKLEPMMPSSIKK